MKSFDRLTKAEKAKVIAAAIVIALLIGFPLMVALARKTTSSRLPSIDLPVIGSGNGETTVLDEPIDERASFDGDKVKGLDVTWNGGEVRLVRGTGIPPSRSTRAQVRSSLTTGSPKATTGSSTRHLHSRSSFPKGFRSRRSIFRARRPAWGSTKSFATISSYLP